MIFLIGKKCYSRYDNNYNSHKNERVIQRNVLYILGLAPAIAKDKVRIESNFKN